MAINLSPSLIKIYIKSYQETITIAVPGPQYETICYHDSYVPDLPNFTTNYVSSEPDSQLGSYVSSKPGCIPFRYRIRG